MSSRPLTAGPATITAFQVIGSTIALWCESAMKCAKAGKRPHWLLHAKFADSARVKAAPLSCFALCRAFLTMLYSRL